MRVRLPQSLVELTQKKIGSFSKREISQAITRLSDFYRENPESPTPWQEPWVQLAYWSYFHPLNTLRCQAALSRCQQVGFFDETNQVHDFGAGLGAATRALENILGTADHKRRYQLYDISSIPLDLSGLKHKKNIAKIPKPLGPQDLLVSSYAMTELSELPNWLTEFSHIILIEPALKEDSQRLLRWRTQLQEKGFSIWAPCPHQEPCPLMAGGNAKKSRDWCHDRCIPDLPDWFAGLEIPMQNRSLSFSYLAAKKASKNNQNLGRMVGDPLVEKGKTRQLICVDSHKKYVSWLHRKLKPEPPARGSLVELPENILEKRTEVRLSENLEEIP